MSDIQPGPWRLEHAPVGVGCGFTDHREYVVDANGNEVTGTISHATELVPGCKRNGEPVNIEVLRKNCEERGRRTFKRGEPFPYSETAKYIADMRSGEEAA